MNDIPIEISEALPKGEIRLIDMAAVRKRIAILDEPRPVTFTSELVGDKLYVTMSQSALRFIDLETGEIL